MDAPQHDDHIWLTVLGSAWAIQSLSKNPYGHTLFHLWRGYEPNLEYLLLTVTENHWTEYCHKAVGLLEACYGPTSNHIEDRPPIR
jgi:hypothetical protein